MNEMALTNLIDALYEVRTARQVEQLLLEFDGWLDGDEEDIVLQNGRGILAGYRVCKDIDGCAGCAAPPSASAKPWVRGLTHGPEARPAGGLT
jgi:hypothetical protein